MPVYTYKDTSMILAHVEKGLPAPVYLIAGDAFLSKEVHQQLIIRLLPEEIRPFNLEFADGEKEPIHSVLDRLHTFPFIPGRKVVSVKNPVQLFAPGNDERLWKKAEEAWKKGQKERCAYLLGTLFQNAGISIGTGVEEFPGNEEDLVEKTASHKKNPLPDWCREALTLLKDQISDGSTNLNADQLLESALRKGFPKDHILILLLEGPPGTKKIVKSISELGVVLNLSLKQSKKGEQTTTLKSYLRSRLFQEGKTIHPQAESLLLERIPPEVFLLEMEIQKLSSYLGDRVKILPNDITELVGASREEPLYELTTVLEARNVEQGLQKLNQLWEQGYNPLQILAAITNSLRRLVLAKELREIGTETSLRVWNDFGAFSAQLFPKLKQLPLPEPLSKVHPFVLFNTLKTAEKFTMGHLIASLEALHGADRLLKTSGSAATFVLQDFIFSFCKKEPQG